uniref:Uncharacterized protein n=1 Tax=Helicotheca tamesis TaxID=374047 RepID=A0A7S2MNJ2_9STRA|mmetsp:Transcript_18969/g.26131  ORF Transcript_18969/g.26131 Transcript_18969/m.26131 type:complete len:165 (+) Transcript_18969:133-627(+)|eukprot:CAMPEP_0185729090 /NCGR_PEP_ID=MMETSP1171-20130828/4463_1 /TAXON_ID=374046 /ORGANISM="Helicotheca tamensis, Strain CCMP826" /LENGTH=164 /DNA_ID=CAMNT_0028397863 /DNA_START=78 /DNA_END=572 /DNA_ORIENTATION=-
MSSGTCDTELGFPSKDELKGAVQGTLLYLSLYFFFFVPFQSFSKFYLLKKKRDKAKANAKDGKPEKIPLATVKYYNNRDPLALKGDRTSGNFIEFAILFLPLLWIHALFVDASESLMICVVYTASRAIYPLVFGKGALLLCSTLPGYVIYMYLMYQITFKFAFA